MNDRPVQQLAEVILATYDDPDHSDRLHVRRQCAAIVAAVNTGDIDPIVPDSSIPEDGYRERELTEDFYLCPNTGQWVYRWRDERLPLASDEGVVVSVEAWDAIGERINELSAELTELRALKAKVDGCEWSFDASGGWNELLAWLRETTE